MKKISLIALVSISLITFSCKEKATEKIENANVEAAAVRDASANKMAVMSFDKTFHDFGQITQGTPQQTVFTFTNTGDAPLIITDATSSCGCTIPDYPKNTPIAPGQQGQMVVNFNGSGQNQVTKTINVQANTANGSELLKIQAFVLAPNAASVPSY
ncbi:MAG: hypothetical protein ABR91_06310 [Polaribacter sp. BACL8 MAG-120531-bin13]|jgi:hypothetical protein|nr:MAG: hypothetical protein ABR91_06310 [Polaribacter sp. BACL8 MAG-120531-bin13]KRP03842.1 MAG: hypothetical protein ABR92_01350 [Polaribacter sp. BACL8 MAG-120619-bin41]KRP14391.1 MAG: hypothetical protein ABR93_01785 [Polaribacter sp. BACL8 MAG-120419-bin8]MBT4840096.1 DUF1573 domain-containing protein [Flavobacteriaceae bacterium]MDA0278636.1 DUF1573 domain-containing protein [Bacteroidota bacterium]NQV63065.1 DUF1573 domain-containing protein [Cryomorphaceae bacterium]|tara:strand:- start:260 stop:730 length:471 start_codon:yes stop_codon:yes gene_type:complete